jgi:chromosome segregation ATPase
MGHDLSAPPDGDLIAQVLFETGKSLDELQNAAELLQRRREMRKKWDAVSGLMAERKKLQQQISEANRELEAAERKHYAIVNPIISDLDQLREATDEGEKAKTELWNTCTDPALLDKMADVQLRLGKRRQEASDLQMQIDNLRDWARQDRTEVERCKMIIDADRQVEMHLDPAKEHESKAYEHATMLPKIEKIISELEQQEAVIRKRMLVP